MNICFEWIFWILKKLIIPLNIYSISFKNYWWPWKVISAQRGAFDKTCIHDGLKLTFWRCFWNWKWLNWRNIYERRRQNQQQKLSVVICWCYQKASRGFRKWAAGCWFSCEPDGDAFTTGPSLSRSTGKAYTEQSAFSSSVLKIEQHRPQGWDTGLME